MTSFSDPTFKALLEAVRDDPFSKTNRLILADFVEEHRPIGMAAVVSLREGRIPLLSFEIQCAKALGCCNFAPATWDKRFAYSIADRATSKYDLSPKQYLWMWVLLRRYRKSVKDDEIKKAAGERYNRCVELLDIKHLKPINRRTHKQTEMQATLLDEV